MTYKHCLSLPIRSTNHQFPNPWLIVIDVVIRFLFMAESSLAVEVIDRDGYYEIVGINESWDFVRFLSDEYTFIEHLRGWGQWRQAWRVKINGVDHTYFVSPVIVDPLRYAVANWRNASALRLLLGHPGETQISVFGAVPTDMVRIDSCDGIIVRIRSWSGLDWHPRHGRGIPLIDVSL